MRLLVIGWEAEVRVCVLARFCAFSHRGDNYLKATKLEKQRENGCRK